MISAPMHPSAPMLYTPIEPPPFLYNVIGMGADGCGKDFEWIH